MCEFCVRGAIQQKRSRMHLTLWPKPIRFVVGSEAVVVVVISFTIPLLSSHPYSHTATKKRFTTTVTLFLIGTRMMRSRKLAQFRAKNHKYVCV